VDERQRAVEGVVKHVNDTPLEWSGERVFVTGATGIVGSWLVRRLLEKGAYVVTLVRDYDPQTELIRSGDINRVSVVSGSLEEYGAIERAINEHEVGTVIHLGAQTIVGTALRNPLPTFESNIRGSYNLLEACRVHRSLVQRVVVASSDKAYGDSDVLPYTESMPLNARHPYDVSKSCTDLLAMTYAHTYGLNAAIARCGNIYGGGDLNWSRIVPGTIRSLLRGETPVIRSDGTFVRDYLHVDDVVDAYLALAAWLDTTDGTPDDIAFNFSDGSPRTVLEMYDAVTAGLGAQVEPQILGEAGTEIHDQHLDASLAQATLGWKVQVDLADGMARTCEWYRRLLSER
jgi:CDP-glucose 4,6-dehydratase